MNDVVQNCLSAEEGDLVFSSPVPFRHQENVRPSNNRKHRTEISKLMSHISRT